MSEAPITIYPFGERAMVVKFGESLESSTYYKVRALAHRLEEQPFMGMSEVLTTYTTVTVFYEPLQISRTIKAIVPWQAVKNTLEQIVQTLDTQTRLAPRIVRIPVCYGEEYGPDLEYVAQYNGLSPQEVIKIHTKSQYLVYMLGFAPGFPYLGGVSKRIATPRRESPRLLIPAGSVGIAGSQTGIYSIATPGGWQIIGATPVALFTPNANPPSLLQAGDIVQFESISRTEFLNWGGVADDY